MVCCRLAAAIVAEATPNALVSSKEMREAAM